jgi:hypothetical protein
MRAALAAAAVAGMRQHASTSFATGSVATPARPRTAIAVATATAAAVASVGAVVAIADAQPTLPQSSMAQWDGLVAEVGAVDAFASMRAIETLVAVAGDADNHDALVRAGAVSALVAAYQPGCVDAARNVAVLRALADLSRKDGAHEAFATAGAPAMLAAVLRDCGVPSVPYASGGNSVGAWLAWAGSWVGIGSSTPKSTVLSPPLQSPKPAKESLPPPPSSATSTPLLDGVGSGNDRLLLPLQSSPALAVGSVDISAGILYHATRCVANMARNSKSHPDLLSSNLLDSMINLVNAAPLHQLANASSLADALGDEQRADTLRFAVLSVAALSKSDAEAVIGKRRLRDPNLRRGWHPKPYSPR